MQKEKTAVLLSLIAYSRDLKEIQKDISKIPWDSDKESVVITQKDIINTLERYLKGEISNHELEMWADLIEGREDIGIEHESKDYISDIIFTLANPEITIVDGEINTKSVLKLLEQAKGTDQ